jgi:coatomer protein complex subunit gamma
LTLTTPARLFNSSPIHPRKCRILLTKIALLLYKGERFPTNEATTLFFGISKLFQNKDPGLRQMVHLIIKELAKSAEDIIMVTSTIMKDTGGSTDAIYRPNAIRALCRIIDVILTSLWLVLGILSNTITSPPRCSLLNAS